jgi:membrane-associated phospholipid phosphatase
MRMDPGPGLDPGPGGGPNGPGELIAGIILLSWSAVAAVLVHVDPTPNKLDAWGFAALSSEFHDPALLRIADLRTTAVLVVGSALAGLTVVGRDRWRAVACLAGPLAAAVLVEWCMKPLVGRRFDTVLDYPSGSVTVVAALATSWSLAVPRRIRWAVMAAGSAVTAMMIVAVIRLRWHYPTDALAGAIVGVGVVLTLDGALQVVRARRIESNRMR